MKTTIKTYHVIVLIFSGRELEWPVSRGSADDHYKIVYKTEISIDTRVSCVPAGIFYNGDITEQKSNCHSSSYHSVLFYDYSTKI